MWRKNTSFKKVVKQAIENGYTDVVVVNEDNRMPNGLIVTHLPNGPTAHFKLSNVKITKEIKVSIFITCYTLYDQVNYWWGYVCKKLLSVT